MANSAISVIYFAKKQIQRCKGENYILQKERRSKRRTDGPVFARDEMRPPTIPLLHKLGLLILINYKSHGLILNPRAQLNPSATVTRDVDNHGNGHYSRRKNTRLINVTADDHTIKRPRENIIIFLF